MAIPSLIRDVVVNEYQHLRPGEAVATIEPTAFQGRAHDVYLVSLTDSSKLIARVARSEQDAEFERRALDVTQHIKKHNPHCRLPITHWHNLYQPERTSIIVLQDLITGKPLGVWNSSLPTRSRHTFLDALAQFLFGLWSTDAAGSVDASATAVSYA
jgi:trans-aconitate methyltransferase